jgi:hypothetical protein
MECVGQRLPHRPQKIQSLIVISTLPLVMGVYTRLRCGYISVAGPVNRFRNTVFDMVKNFIIQSNNLSETQELTKISIVQIVYLELRNSRK